VKFGAGDFEVMPFNGRQLFEYRRGEIDSSVGDVPELFAHNCVV
jgi:hypothetical protein